ncbi:hypothetical protein PMIN03_006057 [Paraphaeosphaeria minitans]
MGPWAMSLLPTSPHSLLVTADASWSAIAIAMAISGPTEHHRKTQSEGTRHPQEKAHRTQEKAHRTQEKAHRTQAKAHRTPRNKTSTPQQDSACTAHGEPNRRLRAAQRRSISAPLSLQSGNCQQLCLFAA